MDVSVDMDMDVDVDLLRPGFLENANTALCLLISISEATSLNPYPPEFLTFVSSWVLCSGSVLPDQGSSVSSSACLQC